MATGLEKLRIYNEAKRLEKEIHALTTNFPQDEKFKTTDQMRRSSSSVVNNIAESYGRYNFGEKYIHYRLHGERLTKSQPNRKCAAQEIYSRKCCNKTNKRVH